MGIEYKITKEKPGCEAGDLSGKWYRKEGLWCRNKEIVVYRDRCTLKLNIRSRLSR